MGYSNYIEVRQTRSDGTVRVQEFRGPGASRAAQEATRGALSYRIQGYSNDGRTIDDMGDD